MTQSIKFAGQAAVLTVEDHTSKLIAKVMEARMRNREALLQLRATLKSIRQGREAGWRGRNADKTG